MPREPRVREAARIDKRRELVGRLRVRGMTIREIAAQLEVTSEYAGISHQTVANDIQAIRKQWRAHAAQDIGDHAARQLAELDEVRRAAWKAGDYDGVRKALETEAKIIGTNAPEKQQQVGGVRIEIVRVDADDTPGTPAPLP